MSGFAARVAEICGVDPDRLERLSGGDLSEVLLVRRVDGHLSVAKRGTAIGVEAAMLRHLTGVGVPAPVVEAEHDGLLLIEYVENDGLFTARAWADIGSQLARLHAITGDSYGWATDHSLGTVQLDNRQSRHWPNFWGQQRLVATASLLDRPWRERVEKLAERLENFLPAAPVPSLLHGDLWCGNMLVHDGGLAAFIDPACYYGDREIDLAMLCLFGAPEASFWEAYGEPAPGWRERRPLYQLFPALVHLRLFGTSYAPLVERLLGEAGLQSSL